MSQLWLFSGIHLKTLFTCSNLAGGQGRVASRQKSRCVLPPASCVSPEQCLVHIGCLWGWSLEPHAVRRPPAGTGRCPDRRSKQQEQAGQAFPNTRRLLCAREVDMFCEIPERADGARSDGRGTQASPAGGRGQKWSEPFEKRKGHLRERASHLWALCEPEPDR